MVEVKVDIFRVDNLVDVKVRGVVVTGKIVAVLEL